MERIGGHKRRHHPVVAAHQTTGFKRLGRGGKRCPVWQPTIRPGARTVAAHLVEGRLQRPGIGRVPPQPGSDLPLGAAGRQHPITDAVGGEFLEGEAGVSRGTADGERPAEPDRQRPPPAPADQPRPLPEKPPLRKGEDAPPHPVDVDRHDRRLDAPHHPIEPAFEAENRASSGNAPLGEDPDRVAGGEPFLHRTQGLRDRLRPGLEKDEPPLAGEHSQEPAADVRPVDEHPQWPGRGEDEHESVEPREVIGHDDGRACGGKPIGMPDGISPSGMNERGNEQPQRGAGGAPDGGGHGPERKDREDREDCPSGEHRRPSRHERRPQPTVGERCQKHATEEEEVGRPEHPPEPIGRALRLDKGLQRHIKHPRPEAEDHQPYEGDPRRHAAGLHESATDAG